MAKATAPLEIDSAIKYKLGLPMGMLELQDTLGGGSSIPSSMSWNISARCGSKLWPGAYSPKLFKEKNWGKKTGKGYYDWAGGTTNEISMDAGVDFPTLSACWPAPSTKPPSSSKWRLATSDEIDKAVLLGLNYPRGIFRMADSTGHRYIVNELNRLYEKYNHEDRYKASSVMTKMVKARQTRP